MWDNTVESDRPQMTIWRRHIACCSLFIYLFTFKQSILGQTNSWM